MRKTILSFILFFLVEPAAAQVATLKINSDMIIHPNQIANVFMVHADKINKTATWDWPEMQFETPYKTNWTQVQAKGPFQLSVHTELLNSRELSFEFYWQNPVLTVGQFNIKDRIVKEVNGVTVIVNVEGSCSGINWTSSNGLWKIRGKLQWGIAAQHIQVQWREFEFVSNPSAPKPVTQYGACVGPEVIQQTLRENVDSVTGDQSKMQALMQSAILSWMNRSLHSLSEGVLQTRSSVLRPNLELEWDPQFMITLPDGLIRVPGYMTLKKAGVNSFPMVIDRTLADADFNSVTESGFILPKNAMEHVAAFLHTAGELNKRYRSTEIKGFQDLFKSEFNSSVVWPDLNSFSQSTVFWFDLESDGTPVLSNARAGTTSVGGVVYDMKTPLVIHDWAPWRGTYYPYVDLRSTVTGTFRASVSSAQNLVLQAAASQMPLTRQFRSEFKSKRSVNEKMDLTRLSTSARDFINNKVTTVAMPKWEFGQDLKANYGNLKLYRQSLMLPVSFVKK